MGALDLQQGILIARSWNAMASIQQPLRLVVFANCAAVEATDSFAGLHQVTARPPTRKVS